MFNANMLKVYVDRQEDENFSRDIVGVAINDVQASIQLMTVI